MVVTGFVKGLFRFIGLMGFTELGGCFSQGKIGIWGGTVNGDAVGVEIILISGLWEGGRLISAIWFYWPINKVSG